MFERNYENGSYRIVSCENRTKQISKLDRAVVVAQLVERRFQFQRSAVRIQSSAKIYIEHLLSTALKRRK